jgi:UDP:flavonoid glycosyltransferase YjiC (YdhE family)
LRVLLGAFGDPGHAFPILALGRGLRARGHDVVVQSWHRWAPDAEAEGLRFAAAPEYHVFPTRERPLKPYEAVARATVTTRELVRDERPDVVVTDILTLAPALAAELEGVPCATLIPHVDPRPGPGFPPYSMGARLPRTAAARALWGLADRVVARGLEIGRVELNETRRRLGLAPLAHVHGGISRRLALVATFPQLEYPRPADDATHVVGPLMWQPQTGPTELPPGDEPLVLVAPSTSQDPDHRMLRAALDGLADLPVRVLATYNLRLPSRPLRVPRNARLVAWVDYEATMPHCAAVVCHAGHGTVVRALASGAAVVACPAAGDMNENAARVAWAGVGVRLPRRLVTPRGIRLATDAALSDPALRARVRVLGDWLEDHDPADRAARLVEGLAAREPVRHTN